METVINVLEEEARKIEREMNSLRFEIDVKEEGLARSKENLSNSKQRLEEIQNHLKSLQTPNDVQVIAAIIDEKLGRYASGVRLVPVRDKN